MIGAYLDGSLLTGSSGESHGEATRPSNGLERQEAAVLALLRRAEEEDRGAA